MAIHSTLGGARGWRRMCVALAGTALALTALPATAQTAAPSDNAMVNLVRLLVEQKVITRAKGDALIAQAESEANRARAAAPAPVQQASSELPPPAAGTIRVPYVPETVRAQIKDELKADVLRQAKAEGWAAPGQDAPAWVRSITLSGDIRVRSENIFYARTNSDQIFDLQAIGQRGVFDVNTSPPSIPFLNTRQDRQNELRLRARLGLTAQITPEVRAGIRFATGEDRSPISTNTSLGGGFGKRDVWLDAAYVEVKPSDWSRVLLGRFDNPFRTNEILFDTDLAFDGIMGEVRLGQWIDDDIQLSLRGGGFPIDFGDRNFPANAQDKRQAVQRYMFAAQLEAGANVGGGVELRGAAGYFHFTNLQSRLSEPCALYLNATECSTDDRAVVFLRNGNTVSPLRQIVLNPNLPSGGIPAEPQLLGLTFDYRLIDINALATIPIGDAVATVGGDYVRNIGFRRSDICRYGALSSPYNNYGSDGNSSGLICDPTNPTSFIGGNVGYQVSASIGQVQPGSGRGRAGLQSFGEALPSARGDWRLFAGYRYVESDAVLGSFSDSDFHLGGTNAKGYFIGGSYGVFDHVSVGARWLSANEISGEPLSIDVLQIDLQAAF